MQDFNTQLEEIQNSRPELVALKSVATELQNVQGAITASATSQGAVSKEQVGALKTLESALKALLDKPEKELDVSTVVTELKSLSEGLKSVQTAVKSIDVKPQVTVDAPTVNVPAPKVTVPKIDLSKLESLINGLPEAIARLIPETPETDLSTLTDGLGALKSVMEDVRDRPIPIPQMGTIKVTNPDGSLVSGGGGGGALNTALKGVTAAGYPTSTAASADRQPLDVTLRDTSGAPVAVGGGTQYADGAVRGTATGTIAMGDDGTNIQSIKTDSSGVLAIQDNGGSITVDGTFFQATQPVSAVTLPLPTGAATSALQLPNNHNVVVTSAPTTAVTGPLTDAQLRATAVPVSGTVTANAGTNLNTSALALDATLTNRTQKSQLTDGTRDGTIKAASTAAVAGDTAVVVAISPNNTVPVSLTSTTITGSVAVTGPLTDAQLRASAVPVSLTSTTVTGTVATKETRSATNTTATVAGSATVVTLIASNANRLGATIYNDSSAILYMKLGATASISDFTAVLAPLTSSVGGYYEVPFGYTGIITGIWASATGNARVGELT
jgi:hypothetical protein